MKAQIQKLILSIILVFFSITTFSGELIAWKFKSGAAFHATPLIDDSILYIGSLDKNFYALNKNTGEKIWQYTTDFEINSKATINDSLVFFESGYKLYALNKITGTLVWSFVASTANVVMSLGLTDYHHSSPLIYNDHIYFGDGWGNMNGVEINTGALKFQYTITTDSAAIRTTPAIQNDTIFFGDWAGHVYAVSLVDKSLLWKYTLEKRRAYYGMVTSDMVIHDTLLYFGSQHDVFSPLSLKTGMPAWTFIDPYKTYLPSTPVFYKNMVIIGSTINAFKIYSLTDGKVNWSCKSDGIFFVHPVIIDSIVIMNTSNFGGAGTLFMINANDGKQMGEHHFNNAAPASPIVDNSKLFVGNGDGYLYAFNLQELLFPKDDTSIFIDTAVQKLSFKTNEEKNSIPFLVENIGNSCDSFYLSYTTSGNPAEKGISVPSTKKGHIAAHTQTRFFSIGVNPEILGPGNYEIVFTIIPKRHPEQVYNKTYQIEIIDAVNIKVETEAKVKVYPNPATEFVCIETGNNPSNKLKLGIYSVDGKMVFNYEGNMQENIIWDLHDLAGNACKSGTYVYKLISKNFNFSGTIQLGAKK